MKPMHKFFTNELRFSDSSRVIRPHICGMKNLLVFTLAVTTQFLFAICTASGHPGSGIVVDAQGSVYFSYFEHGVGKIDPQGKLTYVGVTRGGHWMCLDPDGSFSRTQPKHFQRITPDGAKPTLIYADGGSPIAVLRDGLLYYVSNDERMTPGGQQVTRQSPAGKIEIFPPDGKQTTEKLGITGLAPGPDGSLYIAQPNAVLKLKMDGTFISVASSIQLKGCDVDYPDHNSQNLLPSLRGLAVDEDGIVFAAAVGCRAAIKITPAGRVETVLKSERPWSPTGVAVHRGDVYVLEYTNANGSNEDGWHPRVRKLSRDGKVVTLMTAPPGP